MSRESAFLIAFIILMLVGLLPAGLGFMIYRRADGEVGVQKLGLSVLIRAFAGDLLSLVFYLIFPGKGLIACGIALFAIFLNITLFRFRK